MQTSSREASQSSTPSPSWNFGNVASSPEVWAAIVGSLVGVAAVKWWERARPLAFTESVNVSLAGAETVEVDPTACAASRDAVHWPHHLDPKIHAGLLVPQFSTAYPLYKALKERLPELERIASSLTTASSPDSQTALIYDLLYHSIITDIIIHAYASNSISFKSPVGKTRQKVISVQHSSEHKGCYVVGFKNANLRVGSSLDEREWINERLQPLISAIESLDVTHFLDVLPQIVAIARKQLESLRLLLSTSQKLLSFAERIHAVLSIVNRGGSSLALLPTTEIQFSSAHATFPKMVFENRVCTKSTEDYIQGSKVTGCAIIPPHSVVKIIAASRDRLSAISFAEELRGAGRDGSLKLVASPQLMGLFGRTTSISTSQVSASLNYGDDDISAVQL